MTCQGKGLPAQPPLPRSARTLDTAIELLLGLLLLLLPAMYGTVDARSELVAMALGGVIAVVLAVRIAIAPPRVKVVPAAAAAAAALFVAIAAFQLVPLPRTIAAALSPAAVQTRTDLLGDLPAAPAALSRMPLSMYPQATRHDLRVVLLASLVLGAVVTVYRDNPRRTRRLLATIAAIAGLLGAVALAQDLSGTTRIYWRQDVGERAVSAMFYNHSHFGQFMNLAIGAALGLMLVKLSEEQPGGRRSGRKWGSLVWLGGTVVLGLCTICLSLTRGGVIGMLAGGALTIAALLARRSLRRLLPAVIVLALSALVGLLYFGFNNVYERMADPRGMAGRLQMVRDTSAMIRQYPLLGTGLGSFEWIYPSYNHTNEPTTASHLENEYVQNAAEMGLCGIALVLAFVAIVWRRYAAAIGGGGGGGGGGGAIGLAAVGLGYGLAAVMIHSLSDFGQHLPSVACMSAAVCGLLLNLGSRGEGDSPDATKTIPRGIVIAGGVIMVAGAAWMVSGAEAARRGEMLWTEARRMARRMERRDWEATPQQFAALLSKADDAVAAEPLDAHRRYWAAYYHWRDVARRRDPQTGRIDRDPQTLADADRVIAMLDEARKLCPTYAAPYSVLGQIEHNYLGRAIGVTHIHVAARLDRNDPTALYAAGEVDARRGNFDSAVAYFRRAAGMDYTVMLDVIDLALNQFHRPELAIRSADDSNYLLTMVANAMAKLPEYQPQAQAVYDRAVDVLEAELNQPDAPAWKYATVGSLKMGQRKFDLAEHYYATALALDSSQLAWRLQHARALAELGRFDEAIREAQTAQRMFPASAEAKELVDSLLKPRIP